MARIVKCQTCELKEHYSEDTMTVESRLTESGKTIRKYWHTKCYPEELKKREVIEKDRVEKDELNEVLKKLYNVSQEFPKGLWDHLADLREGTNRYKKFWKKGYKEGVPYRVIKEAYLLSAQSIEWARMSKNFPTLQQEIRYGLVIMQSKINDALRKTLAGEQQFKRNEAMEEARILEMKENREVSFKSKEQDERDFSYLLGDD